MTALYMQIMGILSAMAAASIFFFDKRKREHNQVACLAAWLMFCLYGSLAICAWFRLSLLAAWLLLALLLIHVLNLILVRGNVSKILPESIQSRFCHKHSTSEPTKPTTSLNRRHKKRHRYINQGEHNATHGQ